MLALALIFTLPLASGESDCTSTADCNRLGTEALKAGDFARANGLFEQQIDFAETALKDANDTSDTPRLESAREIAVNNAALNAMRAGNCAMAQAWLDVADGDHKATRANRRQLDARCPAPPSRFEHTGEFRQYAGHGAWNTVSIRPTGDETLELDAFWMRAGRGPLNDYGPAAFGTLERIALHVDGVIARGAFDGNDPAIECQVTVTYTGQTIDLQVTDQAMCQVGGANTWLGGAFLRTGEPAPRTDGEDTDNGDSAAKG